MNMKRYYAVENEVPTTFDVSLSLVFRFSVNGPWGKGDKIEFDVGADIYDTVDGVRDGLLSAYSASRHVSLDSFLEDHYVSVSLHANGRCYTSKVRMSKGEYDNTDSLSGLLAAVMAGLVSDMLVHGTSRGRYDVDCDVVGIEYEVKK